MTKRKLIYYSNPRPPGLLDALIGPQKEGFYMPIITRETGSVLTELMQQLRDDEDLIYVYLNDWEIGFLDQMIANFKKYGYLMYVSEKQITTLEKIKEKIDEGQRAHR